MNWEIGIRENGMLCFKVDFLGAASGDVMAESFETWLGNFPTVEYVMNYVERARERLLNWWKE